MEPSQLAPQRATQGEELKILAVHMPAKEWQANCIIKIVLHNFLYRYLLL